jgi:hypothetical protein
MLSKTKQVVKTEGSERPPSGPGLRPISADERYQARGSYLYQRLRASGSVPAVTVTGDHCNAAAP